MCHPARTACSLLFPPPARRCTAATHSAMLARQFLCAPSFFHLTVFWLVCATQVKDTDADKPEVVHDAPLLRVWHKPSTRFDTPKAIIYLHFHCPEVRVCPIEGPVPDPFSHNEYHVKDSVSMASAPGAHWHNPISFCDRPSWDEGGGRDHASFPAMLAQGLASRLLEPKLLLSYGPHVLFSCRSAFAQSRPHRARHQLLLNELHAAASIRGLSWV
jgi:hypothetical protein